VRTKEAKAAAVGNFTKVQFPDFYNENLLLEKAGIGFGEEETQRIGMSLKRLAKESKAS